MAQVARHACAMWSGGNVRGPDGPCASLCSLYPYRPPLRSDSRRPSAMCPASGCCWRSAGMFVGTTGASDTSILLTSLSRRLARSRGSTAAAACASRRSVQRQICDQAPLACHVLLRRSLPRPALASRPLSPLQPHSRCCTLLFSGSPAQLQATLKIAVASPRRRQPACSGRGAGSSLESGTSTS